MRTHGGAIAVDRSRPERAFDVRERLQADEKGSIGAAGAALVQDGESIALDASTTALSVARQLKARGGWCQLTVITNGLRIASELAGHPGITVLMPGGSSAGRRSRSSASSARACSAGSTSRRPSSARPGSPRLRPGRRHRRGSADQARHGRGRAARSSPSSTTRKWERAAFATFCSIDDLIGVV